MKFEKIDLLKEKIVQELLDVIFLHASYTDQETFIEEVSGKLPWLLNTSQLRQRVFSKLDIELKHGKV